MTYSFSNLNPWPSVVVLRLTNRSSRAWVLSGELSSRRLTVWFKSRHEPRIKGPLVQETPSEQINFIEPLPMMHVFHFTQWKNSTITRGLTCESEKQHSAEACWGHLVQSGSVQTGALVRKCETSMSCVQRKNKNQVSFYGKVNKTRQGSINCAKFVYCLSESMIFFKYWLVAYISELKD